MKIIDKVERLREDAQISQVDLCEAVGMEPYRYTKLKNNARINPLEVLYFARFFGVSCESLIDPHALRPEPAAPLGDQERSILEIIKTIGSDIALRRLTGAPDIRPTGPTWEQVRKERDRAQGRGPHDRRIKRAR